MLPLKKKGTVFQCISSGHAHVLSKFLCTGGFRCPFSLWIYNLWHFLADLKTLLGCSLVCVQYPNCKSNVIYNLLSTFNFIYIFLMSISPHQKYRKCKSQLPSRPELNDLCTPHQRNNLPLQPSKGLQSASSSLPWKSFNPFKSSAPDWLNHGPNTKAGDP